MGDRQRHEDQPQLVRVIRRGLGCRGRSAGRRVHRQRGDTTGSRSTRKKEKDAAWQKKQKRKICIFCKDHIDYVDYKDVIMLRKFVSERGKIRARRVTGNCVQHQRDVATAVKNAREMALLPYSAR
jgi:small subunit ribosomal protein S18